MRGVVWCATSGCSSWTSAWVAELPQNRVGNPDGSSFSKTLAGGRVPVEAGLYTRPTDMTVKALFEMSQHMHARLDTTVDDSVVL
jgi:hypothetical protein